MRRIISAELKAKVAIALPKLKQKPLFLLNYLFYFADLQPIIN